MTVSNELDEQYLLAAQDPNDPVWPGDAVIAEMAEEADDPNDVYTANTPTAVRTNSGALSFLQDIVEAGSDLLENDRPIRPKKPMLDAITTRELGSDKWRGGRRVVNALMEYPLIVESPKRRTVTLINYGPGTVYLSSVSGAIAGASNTIRLPVSASVGTGTPLSIVVPNPAVATDWSYTIPAGQSYLVQGWRGRFQTDANVATRTVNFRIERPTTFEDFAIFTAAAGQAASNIVVYQGTKGIGELPAVRNGGLQMMFPDGILLEAGSRIGSVTQNMQAGDQWSEILLEVVAQSNSVLLTPLTIPTRDDIWAVCGAGETALVEVLEVFDLEESA